ncbi:histidine phosphatase family protein [Parasedimentitalea marina]|uniref:Histidine phosphatase family protein n=1 Tax=Parasedimentitalea marina TaxID=2483033 RepID=A0A3T0N4Q6_9RHOB|nr:histidine phosphatase family protein [Parasedimentitalea marina]AZV79023.1 histidine phosphatase family protein [Parasedimentitalea marina]
MLSVIDNSCMVFRRLKLHDACYRSPNVVDNSQVNELAKDIRDWTLSKLRQRRVITLANSNAQNKAMAVISRSEIKATETARPLAAALNCELEVRELMHENDRGSTSFLSSKEFEIVADQFLASSDTGVGGWETTTATQSRIVADTRNYLSVHDEGDVFFVGHGAVSTLLYCYLFSAPIDRKFEQISGGVGILFQFSTLQSKPTSHLRPMGEMIRN